MDGPSDHLLRTFGAIPASSRVLDLGCGRGSHTDPLVKLGFDVFACDTTLELVETVRSRLSKTVGEVEARKRCSVSRLDALEYPEAFFDWIVAFECLSRIATREGMLDVLREARRVLKSGGWFYVAVPVIPEDGVTAVGRGYAGDSGLAPTFTPRTLDELLKIADFASAERPSVALDGGRRLVQAIYRKIDEHTPA